MLGDPTRLHRGDLGLPDGIQEGGLAVVHMPHDRNHRRPRAEGSRVILLYFNIHGIRILFQLDWFRFNAEFFRYHPGRFIIDFLV